MTLCKELSYGQEMHRSGDAQVTEGRHLSEPTQSHAWVQWAEWGPCHPHMPKHVHLKPGSGTSLSHPRCYRAQGFEMGVSWIAMALRPTAGVPVRREGTVEKAGEGGRDCSVQPQLRNLGPPEARRRKAGFS